MKNFSYLLVIINFCSLLYSNQNIPTTLLAQSDEESIRHALSHEFADLPIKTCSLLIGGWDNTVVEINGEWIFRFPRQKQMAEIMTRETALLNYLNPLIDMPIPQYEFFGKEIALVGYRKLQGAHFFNQDYCTLSDIDKQAIAESLALFIAQMHTALSVKKACEFGYAEYRPDLAAIEKSLLGTLPSTNLDRLVAEAVTSARQQIHDHARLVLIHNDLHGENMAYDPVMKKIVGIFDFSDAVVADFAIEFSKLFLIDANLVERTALAYTRMNQSDIQNILRIAATDHIIRRATYILEFRCTGNQAKEAEMLEMLTLFLPIWEKLK